MAAPANTSVVARDLGPNWRPGPNYGVPPGGIAASSPLLNPNQALSGQSLLTAAQGLVNAQTAGPLAELARQIASNNSQSQAAVNQAGGFYNQLGQQAQSGANQVNAIGTGLNTQLGQIASDTQGQLGQIGQNASASLLKYAPQSDASNSLAQPAMQSLTQELARQQGLAAQSQGAFRAFGANQGANYGGLAASNLGTFALKGQEGLRGIAQAGQLKNEPLMSKVANIQAARGSDLTTAIGKLRQAEVNNSIAQAGLGIKAQANAISAANNAATNQTSAQNNLLTNQTSALNNQRTTAQQNIDSLRTSDTSTQNNLRDQSTRMAIANMKTGTGATKPLPQDQQNNIYRNLDQMMTLIQAANKAGHKEADVRQALATGQMQKGFPAQSNILVQAAYELLGYGSIDQKTAGAMHQMGLRGGQFRGQPIRVSANYSKANPAMNPPGAVNRVGNAVNTAASALGSIFKG